MNKKLLTVAIGAAFAAPMFAQAAVTVGGQAHISADYVDTFIGTAASKMWNVSSNVSGIYFKAEEDLGGGLTGVFYLQEYFRLDNNYGGVGANRMHDAPAYAGLASKSLGTVLLGNLDGPAKNNGRSVDLFGNAIGDSRNAGVDNARLQNTIAYVTPNFAGVSVTVAHSTNVDNATNVKTGSQLSATALGVKFDQGPVMVGAAVHKIINQLDTGATYADNDLMNVALGLKFGPARVVGFYQKAEGNGNVNGTDADTYGIGASFKFGNETVKGQFYNVTRMATGAADISSTVIAIGLDHAFSKTFTGYVAVASSSNDVGGTVGMAGGGGHGDTPPVTAGEDQTGLSLGLIFNF